MLREKLRVRRAFGPQHGATVDHLSDHREHEIVKALTVVSVVGVPPVLIPGIYGMNFKNMPELNWSLGYPLAVTLIVASALLPVVDFQSLEDKTVTVRDRDTMGQERVGVGELGGALRAKVG